MCIRDRYTSDDIRNAEGTVVVKKGTLIEKATTGADGTAKFTADLPIGYSYSVKEVKKCPLEERTQHKKPPTGISILFLV